MDQSLGQKIDKRCGPQFGPDKKCKEKGTFARSEKGRTALSFDGIVIIAKDANLLKMLLLY
jgi:hypothetical protein